MNGNITNNGNFKEAVCIEAQRIFDSCSDRDCLEDLELTFEDECAYSAIETAAFVKTRCVEVISTFFSIEPVPFNKGFFSVDITYTFKAEVEVYQNTCSSPSIFIGQTTFNKKVLLFGSDGNTKYFKSTDDCGATQSNGCCTCFTNLPTATVSVVDPISLDSKIVCTSRKHNDCKAECERTESDENEKGGSRPKKTVAITIGMFSIVSLSRAVPILIPAYDYCIPQKECSNNSDSPCELFEKIAFPTKEFFPRGLDDDNCENNCSCGCSDNESDE